MRRLIQIYFLLKKQYENASEDIKARFDDKVMKIQQGDDLLPTVMKVVKVFVAVKKEINAWR